MSDSSKSRNWFNPIYVFFTGLIAAGMFVPYLLSLSPDKSADPTAKSDRDHSITICADFDKQEEDKTLAVSIMIPFTANSFHKILDNWKRLGNSYCQRVEGVFTQGYTTRIKTYHPRLESIAVWYYKYSDVTKTNQTESFSLKSKKGIFEFKILALPNPKEYKILSIAPNTPSSPPLVPN